MTSERRRSKDFDVRRAIVRRLLDAGIDRRDIRHELTLDTSSSGGRVDLVVLRDRRLIGIEIKSGSDKLDRLEGQLEAMRRAFDSCKVVIDTALRAKVGSRFWQAGPFFYNFAEDRLHDCWLADTPVDGAALIAEERGHASRRTTTRDMACLLWRDEAVGVCQALKMQVGTREKGLDWLRENVSLKELRPLVIEELRGRTLNRWEEAFWRDYEGKEMAA